MEQVTIEDLIPAGRSPGLTSSHDLSDFDQDFADNDFEISDLEPSFEEDTCEICHRQFKGKRGLRIHLGKTQCGESLNRILLDSRSNSGQDGNLEENHNDFRPPSEIRDRLLLSKLDRRPCINWPIMSNKRDWEAFDEEAERVVKPLLHGPVEQKLRTFEKMVHAIAENHFGVKEKISREHKPNRRIERIKQLRKEMRSLRRRILSAPEEEKDGLKDLGNKLHEEILKLRRAERACKRRRERKSGRRNFMKDPFRAAKKILDPSCKIDLNCSKADLNDHLDRTYSSTTDGDFEDWEGAIRPDPPSQPFADSAPTFKELRDILKRTRNASAPGQNGIPYKMYKSCPRLLRLIWRIMAVVWRTKKIPIQWRVAEGVYIQKSATSNEKTITDFRPISLLNVEAKLFFAVQAKRLERYLCFNGFLDKTVQKGGVCGQPGVWEHISTLWETVRDARTCRKNLAVIWLDLANAFGSVPHAAISFALRWYHLPETFVELIEAYYAGLYGRFSVQDWTSDWQKFSIGIFMGCTLSPILFVTTFNLLNEFVSQLSPKLYFMKKKDTHIPVLKEYMDDITICTASVASAQEVLGKVNEFMKWSRMRIKPAKSRSLVLKHGKVSQDEPFEVNGQVIPGVQNNPVKFLGRIINGDLNDKQARASLETSLERWLKLLDKCVLTGVMKCWCYNHLILPRIQWQLMIYEIAISFVERLETLVSRFLRKWLGFSRNLSSVALYCKQAKLRLPLVGLTETAKKTSVNCLLQLRASSDEVVQKVDPVIRCGRKWKPAQEAQKAEDKLRFEDIARGQSGRAGLGLVKYREPWTKMSNRERRTMISKAISADHDDEMFARAVQQGVQGRWTTWENVKRRDLKWRTLYDLSPKLLQFIIGATYDTLASPKNLERWNLADDDACPLCGGGGCTTSHILAGCPTSLQQGRYTWRHNRVLRVLLHGLREEISYASNLPARVGARGIHFVRPGETLPHRPTRRPSGLLSQAQDWKIMADLDTRLVFPEMIAITNQRPDIVIFSEMRKSVMMLELTVCEESNMLSSHERKAKKYEELESVCFSNGWSASVWPVEVGCRGFASNSLLPTLYRLGFRRPKAIALEKQACGIAERASFHLWIKRLDKSWGTPHD